MAEINDLGEVITEADKPDEIAPAPAEYKQEGSVVVFYAQEFREIYPEFSNAEVYSEARLNNAFVMASTMRANKVTTCTDLAMLKTMLYLLTAHYLFMQDKQAQGGTAGLVSGATIGQVSVTIAVPTKQGDLRLWLGQSGYGQNYLALASLCSVGGVYVGGKPEQLAYPHAGL